MDYKQSLDNFFRDLDRSYFMNKDKDLAGLDCALPIECGQTISQPSLVKLMTELLELDQKCKVLEIGTGSGYQTCFLAEFSKTVYTVERFEALRINAMDRLDDLGYKNINFILGDGSDGYEKGGPYDRIMVTAAACEVPLEYLNQLRAKGIMIIPVGDSYVQNLMKIRKDDLGEVYEEVVEGVRFVPLVGRYSI